MFVTSFTTSKGELGLKLYRAFTDKIKRQLRLSQQQQYGIENLLKAQFIQVQVAVSNPSL